MRKRYRYNRELGRTVEVFDEAQERLPEVQTRKDIGFKSYQVADGAAAGARHVDSDGCPVFTSKADVKAFLRSQREQGFEATYGDGWNRIEP